MQDIGNIAVIAHVDHGKTTLVDKMMLAGKLFRDGQDNSGEVLDYAFAIREDEHRGLKTLAHTGSFMGFKAYYVRFPEQQFSTWVLCNMGAIVPQGLGLEVAELYMGDLMTGEPGSR